MVGEVSASRQMPRAGHSWHDNCHMNSTCPLPYGTFMSASTASSITTTVRVGFGAGVFGHASCIHSRRQWRAGPNPHCLASSDGDHGAVARHQRSDNSQSYRRVGCVLRADRIAIHGGVGERWYAGRSWRMVSPVQLSLSRHGRIPQHLLYRPLLLPGRNP